MKGKETLRLDQLLVDRGLIESREKAQRLILAGSVLVNGQAIHKPSQKIPKNASLEMKEKMPFVSRGGEKLEAAFRSFPISVQGKIAADLGASTGGFTDCLLQHGAKKVYAVDVGYGQLSYSLRENPKVICREKINARYLKREDFPETISFVVCDVSFISVTKLFSAMDSILSQNGEGVLLLKPQFEARRSEIKKGGVVKDPKVHERIIKEISEKAKEHGLLPQRCIPSPLKGPKGNIEFLLWIKKTPLK